MKRQLRPALPGGRPARLDPDPLPALGVIHQLAERDTNRMQLIEQVKLGQRPYRMWLEG
jgi:hypothetical protein